VLAFSVADVLPAMAVQVSLNLGWAILNAPELSFIGLGVTPPTPEWASWSRMAARFISTASVAGRVSGLGNDAGGCCASTARATESRHSRSPHANMTASLLAVQDLHVTFSTRRGLVEAVRGVTLSLREGEMLALSARAAPAVRHRLCDHALLDAAGGSRRATSCLAAGHPRKYRGAIPQSAWRSDGDDFPEPARGAQSDRAIGDQIADAILAHKRIARGEARAEALQLLRAVQIRDPEKTHVGLSA